MKPTGKDFEVVTLCFNEDAVQLSMRRCCHKYEKAINKVPEHEKEGKQCHMKAGDRCGAVVRHSSRAPSMFPVVTCNRRTVC
jgi:hypothetical protein